MANPSLTEFLAQSQRGLYQSVFGGTNLSKAAAGVGVPWQVDGSDKADIFQTTYGRKVWQALNNQTRFFNAIPRVVWGNTAGWRVRSDRGASRSRPVTEIGTIPGVDVSKIQTVSSLPRIVSTTFGASVKAVFTAQLEGGVGDVLALENENAQIDHLKEVNTEILAANNIHIAAYTDTDTFTVPSGAEQYLNIGDTFKIVDSDGTNSAALTVDTDSFGDGTATTVETTAAISGFTAQAADLCVVTGRAGFTSLDDVVNVDDERPGGVVAAAGIDPGAYDITTGTRAAGGWNAAATATYNAGTGRDLSLNLMDTCIQKIRENGGEPKLILLGHDQYFKLERLLNSQQRYMGQEEYQVGIGSERTYPGTRTGLVLSTYMGIPILPDADVAKSVSSADAVLGTDVFVLDTDYIEMAIAQPTQYVENRDYFAANALVVRGLLYTMGEMRVKNIWTQAKISDLNS